MILLLNPESTPSEVEIDWDKGLPVDVLGLMAKTGGMSSMKSMRGVSKTWQQGYELGVSHIKLHTRDTSLPWEAQDAAQRFPCLTSLDVGHNTAANPSMFQTLSIFPNLKRLIIGPRKYFPRGGSPPNLAQELPLNYWIRDVHLAALRDLALTSLDLSGCWDLSKQGLQCLRDLPHLAQLNLHNFTLEGWTNAELEALLGLPVTAISLGPNRVKGTLTEACLETVAVMPLTRLSFSNVQWLTEAGLENLRKLPLTSLSL